MRTLDANLAAYVELVRNAVLAGTDDADLVERVMDSATELLERGVRLDDRHRTVPNVGYGRNLVHEDDEAGFVVVAMVWPPGFRGLPHDHGTWGVVGVVEGEVDIANFTRTDGGRDPTRVDLAEVSGVRAGPGGVAHVLPPDEDFHSVGNASETQLAITLHTYGRDITSCTAVTLATGRAERMCPRYTSRPA